MKRLFLLGVGLAFVATLGTVGGAHGQEGDVLSAFRLYKEVDGLSLAAPTVVEVPFGDEFMERRDFAIFNQSTGGFEPYLFKQETSIATVPLTATTDTASPSTSALVDGDTDTYADFILPTDAQGQVQVIVRSAEPVASSAITLLLDDNVALPTSIEIQAATAAGTRIVVAQRKMDRSTIRFPKTVADEWFITLRYAQPLRVTELTLHQDDAPEAQSRVVRFLAQPVMTYRVYFDSDRAVAPPVGEAGNLAADSDVLELSALPSRVNEQYVIADIDEDGVPNVTDNCVTLANFDQADVNGNERGDVCDDFDRDGVLNSHDNCPNIPNRAQRDEDGDGVGDACDDEESRITERYTWIPWVGIGVAAVVLGVLFALTARSVKRSGSAEDTGSNDEPEKTSDPEVG